MAATRADARARWDHHRTVPAPPASVLTEPVTRDLVDDWADWFLNGRGYLQASTTRCAHGRRLTEFCDTCD
ncbi:hypothetical protein [Nocardia thailandica]|uniref:hypothetical protein n=1 Tax=Nocardia thailandica TaxID=257275 RepID=UPI0005BAB11B|nr:hypothetical protein [Nocardia thailandica]